MWFKGGCEGEGGGFGSVTLTFVSRIGPHWPLADFPGATTVQANPNKSNKGQFHGNWLRKWATLQQKGRKRARSKKEVVPVWGGHTKSPCRATHTHHHHCNELVRGLQTSSSVQAVNCSHLQTRTPAALPDHRFKILGLRETSLKLCNLLSSYFQTIQGRCRGYKSHKSL